MKVFRALLIIGTVCLNSTQAYAQLGQSDWIVPAGSADDEAAAPAVKKKHKHVDADTQVIRQSGWIKPAHSSLDNGQPVMLNAVPAEMQESQDEQSDPVQAATPQTQVMTPPVATPTMENQQPVLNGAVSMQQPAVPAYVAPATVATQMPAMPQAPVVMQPRVWTAPPAQPQQYFQSPSSAAAPQPVQTTQAWQNPPQPAPFAVPSSSSDDSLSRVVFGIPGNAATDAALASQANNEMKTMAAMNNVGDMVGGMLQGMGFDNHFHTYGPGGSYPGRVVTSGGLVSGVLGALTGGLLGGGGPLVTCGPYTGSYAAVRAAMDAAGMANLRQAQAQAGALQAGALARLRH